MGDTPQNTGEGNESTSPFEQTEKIFDEFIEQIGNSEWSAILASPKEKKAFQAAEPRTEPTEEDMEAIEEAREADGIKQWCDCFRKLCKSVIEKKIGSPDSEAYKAAKTGLELLGKIEKGDYGLSRELKDNFYILFQAVKAESELPSEGVSAEEQRVGVPSKRQKHGKGKLDEEVKNLLEKHPSWTASVLVDKIYDTQNMNAKERKSKIHCVTGTAAWKENRKCLKKKKQKKRKSKKSDKIKIFSTS